MLILYQTKSTSVHLLAKYQDNRPCVCVILTHPRQAYSKQVCLWDLAQIICIAFIIQAAWDI